MKLYINVEVNENSTLARMERIDNLTREIHSEISLLRKEIAIKEESGSYQEPDNP